MELFGGMREACDEYALWLVGGDLSRGREASIAVTVTGEVAPGKAVLRSGAHSGDRIVVTGELGGSAAGLAAHAPADDAGPSAQLALVRRHLRPAARVGEGGVLARARRHRDDRRLGRVGDRPLAPGARERRRGDARRSMTSPWRDGATLDDALGGGEDYELLATLPDAAAVEAARIELKEAFGVTAHRDRPHRRGRPASPRSTPTAPSARSDADRLGPLPMTRAVTPPRPRALTIAGSDSGGGAGIQADLKTFSALGVYGMTAITAITVQNTKGVYGSEAMSPKLVGRADPRGDDRHRRRRREDGHAGEPRRSSARWRRPSRSWRSRTWSWIPCSSPSTGTSLLAEDAVDELRSRILPLAALVTPNLAEASGLAGLPGRGEGRHAPGGRRDPGARAACGAGQGRPPRGLDRGRRPVRLGWDRGMARRPTGSTCPTRTGRGARCPRRSRRIWRWDGNRSTRSERGRRS